MSNKINFINAGFAAFLLSNAGNVYGMDEQNQNPGAVPGIFDYKTLVINQHQAGVSFLKTHLQTWQRLEAEMRAEQNILWDSLNSLRKGAWVCGVVSDQAYNQTLVAAKEYLDSKVENAEDREQLSIDNTQELLEKIGELSSIMGKAEDGERLRPEDEQTLLEKTKKFNSMIGDVENNDHLSLKDDQELLEKTRNLNLIVERVENVEHLLSEFSNGLNRLIESANEVINEPDPTNMDEETLAQNEALAPEEEEL